MHWPWSAANRLIATEWCSRFRRYISHYGKWRDETRRMTSRTVERIRRERANRQRGGAGGGRQEEGMKGATRRIRTISYNHPCLFSFSSIFLSLSPRQSGSRYFSGPHAFLYLTIVGQRSTSRAGNGLLTNLWRLLYAWSDGRPLIFKDIADTLNVTIKCEIENNMFVHRLLTSSIIPFLQLNSILFLLRLLLTHPHRSLHSYFNFNINFIIG